MNRMLFPLVALLLLCGGGRAAAQGKENKLPAGLDAKPLTVASGDDELRQLQKQRFNAALSETRSRYHEMRTSGTGLTLLLAAIQRLSEAERGLQPTFAERVEVYKKAVEILRHLETLQEKRFKAGEISRADMDLTHYARLDAQIHLLEAQRDAKLAKGK